MSKKRCALRVVSYLVSSIHVTALIKKILYLVHFSYSKLDFGGHLEFCYFPELGSLGTSNMFFRIVFSVVSEKNQLVTHNVMFLDLE